MNKVLISLSDKKSNDAGPKAKRDIEKFLLEDGFKLWKLNFKLETGMISRFQKLFVKFSVIPRYLRKNKDIDAFFIQYPLYSTYLTESLIEQIGNKTNAKLYFIIHDIESLRLFVNDDSYKKSEIEMFNKTDGLVVHNDKMKTWLLNQGVKVPMESLEIFDYDNPEPLVNNSGYEGSVCFAGNLAKAEFFDKLQINHLLKVFGPNNKNVYPKNIEYGGQYTPEQLPRELKQNFGLVWDGDTTTSCTGVFGEYMKYNNPHKVSLYLSSGLPVIIWKKAALAEFIESNNLGIAIDSLNDVDEILNKLSLEEYRQKKENVMKMAAKLRSGFYIKKAVSKVIN